MNLISVTILLKGSPIRLREVLSSVASFDEVLIYDNGADASTIEICMQFQNVHIVKGPFLGFGSAHNLATEGAKHNWIFSIDSDEVVTPALKEEIMHLKLDLDTAYSVARHNEFNGKWIKWCGWFPDRVVRLYNRTKTGFSENLVHEGVKEEGVAIIPLKGFLRHFSYNDISDFLSKMQIYSDLFAKQHTGKKKSSPLKAILHAKAAFFKSFILKKGFLGGFEGLLISIYNAQTAFYKYLKLYEANLKHEKLNNLSVTRRKR